AYTQRQVKKITKITLDFRRSSELVFLRVSPYALLLTLQGRLDLTSAQIRTQGGKNIVEIQEQTF
ncbi:unnamed protein product, partial [Larinioides sclopetarius]